MKKYTKPEIEISVFATEDVITLSSVTPEASLTKGDPLTDSSSADVSYNDIFG